MSIANDKSKTKGAAAVGSKEIVMPRAAKKHERVKMSMNLPTGEWSLKSAKTGENLMPGKNCNLNLKLRREA